MDQAMPLLNGLFVRQMVNEPRCTKAWFVLLPVADLCAWTCPSDALGDCATGSDHRDDR